jgi:hypothetical protein
MVRRALDSGAGGGERPSYGQLSSGGFELARPRKNSAYTGTPAAMIARP